MSDPYYRELELFIKQASPAQNLDVRLGIANIDREKSRDQEWVQCLWAQGGVADPRLPSSGTWMLSEGGNCLELSGSGISRLSLKNIQYSEMHGDVVFQGSLPRARELFSGKAGWRWLFDYDKSPFYHITEDSIRNELVKRGGMMERVINFFLTPDGHPRYGNYATFFWAAKDFVGSYDSDLFTFTYPAFSRHRVRNWRGRDMHGWEANYYFIGFGFRSLSFPWAEVTSMVHAWKGLKYNQMPSAACMSATRLGFDEADGLWQRYGLEVRSRMNVDKKDWDAKLARLHKLKPGLVTE